MSARRHRPGSANARHHAEWLSLMDVSGPFISLPVLDRVFPQGLDPHDPERSTDLRRHYGDWTEEAENPTVDRSWVLAVLNRTLEIPLQLILEPAAFSKSLDVRVAQHHETLRPDLVIVEPPGRPSAGRPRVLIQIVPRHQNLEKALEEADWKASPATRITELIRGTGADGVRLGLLTNGEQWMLVHAPRGETAGYATWQAELWLEEPITLRGFRSLLGVRRLFGVPDGETLEALYSASANDQQEVTDRLGLQVRRAVEILFQAIDCIDQDRNRKLLEGFDEKQLYSAALTVMMRLVFLLYAEEQRLLPIEDPFYAQHYAASTLLEQLQDDEDRLGEQVLERRHAAWNRLLATFRAVHGGIEHESLRLPAYGGGLFDPDHYPFLEGRGIGSKWREVSAQPLRISDSTVLDLLRSIQFLEVQGLSGGGAEAQHLSFKALGVEQIGHVYESLLDHTAVRAESTVIGLAGPREPEIALTELEQYRKKGHDALLDFLVDRTGKSRNALDNALAYQIESDDNRWLVCCGNDTRLFGRVQPWAGLVREDSQGLPTVIAAGSVYATTGSHRRSTGTYYTPRSLTEPIVQYTLEPLVYQGPAEGKPEEEWELRSARDILALKVCDMACGSGAFLVQACRYLSERLVEAWSHVETATPGMVVVTPEGELSEARPNECIIPKDADERLAVARRLVADRCLYGVDVNPMAVEMAKLSLWLVTLEKNRPFTFIDHAIKCGDSLLGVSSVNQIKDFSLDPDEPRRYLGVAEACEHALSESERLRSELEALPVVDISDADKKAQLLQRADETVAGLRAVGDVLVGEALAIATRSAKDDQAELAEVPTLVQDFVRPDLSLQEKATSQERLRDVADRLLRCSGPPVRRPFHWPLEFPEVFDDGGFHALVMNPPFKGGKQLRGLFGDDYMEALRARIKGLRGSPDLVAYFVLRAHSLLRQGGVSGFISTKSILQGETRESSLDILAKDADGRIVRQVPNQPWPGDAAVIICVLWIEKAATQHSVPAGSADAASRERHTLVANIGHCFQGTNIVNSGFAVPADWAMQLIRQSPKYSAVLKPLCEGAALNAIWDDRWPRWIIDFQDWSLEKAARFPKCLDVVTAAVKPQRDASNRERYRKFWWQFGERQVGLYERAQGFKRVIAIAYTSNTLAFAFVQSSGIVYYNCTVICSDNDGLFAALQSSLHLLWVREFGSTLKGDARYAPERCFETFPFPVITKAGERAGRAYLACRQELLTARREGLTKLYGQFHSIDAVDRGIIELRDLHIEMDLAVAASYQWDDLKLGHGFHKTPYGVRFTISESARYEVLNRLLGLNRTRHAVETAQGRQEGDRKRRRTKGTTNGVTLF
jgi:hypothetical protein